MRRLALLLVSALTITACGKSSGTTAPTKLSTGLSGSWSGCYTVTFPNGTSSCNSATLTITESSGNVSGTATAGNQYGISGTLDGSAVSLLATGAAQNGNWTYTGTLAGNTITGQIAFSNATYALTFNRTQ